jgi:outer membrane protein OmpA-like peptidoglycan-associated protein
MPRLFRIVLFLVFAWLTVPCPARAQRLPVDIKVFETVSLPLENPRLTITTRAPVRDLKVVVTDHGTTIASKDFPPLGTDAVQELTWSAEPGVYTYTINISGKTAEGEATASAKATVTVMRPLEILIQREQVDLQTRQIPFRINNPPGHVEIAIYNALGQVLYEGDVDLRTRPPDRELEVSWPELKEPIARIELRVFDISNSWVGIELVPFRIEIPHIDVIFETAKWRILPAEKTKLDDAYERLVQVIAEHGAEMKASVYILGHTDTVGSDQDNKVLSTNRAQAIARYFKDKGRITLPILACGFGETMLAVKTADNVDEQKNRRAQYILAAEPPLPCNWMVVSPGSEK